MDQAGRRPVGLESLFVLFDGRYSPRHGSDQHKLYHSDRNICIYIRIAGKPGDGGVGDMPSGRKHAIIQTYTKQANVSPNQKAKNSKNSGNLTLNEQTTRYTVVASARGLCPSHAVDFCLQPEVVPSVFLDFAVPLLESKCPEGFPSASLTDSARVKDLSFLMGAPGLQTMFHHIEGRRPAHMYSVIRPT